MDNFNDSSSFTGVQEEDVIEKPAQSDQQKFPYREQDIYLPIANVARIMKSSVPANGKISKEAKECVQECVSEFISFITSEAAEHCAQEKRKTINGEDVLFAMATLGFDPYIEPLKVYLQNYRDSLKSDKSIYTRREDGLSGLGEHFNHDNISSMFHNANDDDDVDYSDQV